MTSSSLILRKNGVAIPTLNDKRNREKRCSDQ